MSRPIHPSRHVDAVEHAMLGVGREPLGDHEIARQLQLARPRRAAPARARDARAPASSSSHSDVADRVALRAQERKAHRAADDHRVGDLQEAVDHGDLVGHLGAADHRHERTRAGFRGSDRQRAHLALEQPSGRARQQVRDALGAGVRAVRGAERVVHVHVGQLRQRAAPTPGRWSSRPARSARSRAPAARPRRAARRAP